MKNLKVICQISSFVLLLSMVWGCAGADARVFGRHNGYKDISVTTADEDKSAWQGGTHCLSGKIAVNDGVRDILADGDEEADETGITRYEPGSTVTISYNVWNAGGEVISDMPVSIGWFTYTDDYKELPVFTPVPYEYTIRDLPSGQCAGTQNAAIKLPLSFDGLPLVTGKTVKERVKAVYGESRDIIGLDDQEQFLSMAVIADPEKALAVWPRIFAARGGINYTGDEEIRLENNIMIVLVPIRY